MSDALQAISDDLVALSKRSGVDEHGYNKIMIPQPHDRGASLDHLKKCGYQKQKSFPFTDFSVIGEVKTLHAAGRSVWVMLDLSGLKFDLYVSSLQSSRKAGSPATTSSATGGFARLAETEQRLKPQAGKTTGNGLMAKILNAFRGK